MMTGAPLGKALQAPAPLPEGGVRLFYFPYAGGSAAACAHWQRQLPAWLQLCLVELPGRSWRFAEPFPRSLPDLAASLAAELRPYAAVTCAVYGHSMGALLAYEVAKRLEAFPEVRLRKLLISGSAAPSRRKRADPPVSHYSDVDLVQLLVDMKGTAPQVLADADLMSLLLPRLRADYALCENYADDGSVRLRVPVASLCGDQDIDAAEEDMLFWREVTRGSFTSHIFPGGHFFVLEHEEQLMATLAAELETHRMQSVGA